MDEELNPQVELVADTLLELIGEVTKLNVQLAELPDEDILLLSGRLSVFLATIEALPVKQTGSDSLNWGHTVGEA